MQPEPITGDPTWPAPGDETGPIRPFDPPPTDTPSDVPIEALTPEEQAYVEQNLDVETADWPAVHTGFGVATQQAAEHAEAEAAANTLGLAGLGELGVTP